MRYGAGMGRKKLTTTTTETGADLVLTSDGGRALDVTSHSKMPATRRKSNDPNFDAAKLHEIKGRGLSARERSNRQARVGLAICIRERVPAELMVDYQMAILAGYDPLLKLDEDTGDYYVWYDESDTRTTTPERRDAAMTVLRQYAHGMPAQKHVVDMDVQRATQGGGEIPASAVEGMSVMALIALERIMANPGGDPYETMPGGRRVIDAAAVEAPADAPPPSSSPDDTHEPEGELEDETTPDVQPSGDYAYDDGGLDKGA